MRSTRLLLHFLCCFCAFHESVCCRDFPPFNVLLFVESVPSAPSVNLNPSTMSSQGSEQTVQALLQRVATWVDLESAAVVTILFGLFQVLLSVPLAYSTFTMPGLFMMPLGLGILIIAGGSFTIANERNPSRRLLQGCACSNAIGLLGALIAFCIYCYNISIVEKEEKCSVDPTLPECAGEFAKAYSWSVTLLLLIYDSGAIFLNCLLSVFAIKALKND